MGIKNTVLWDVTPCNLAHRYQNTQCHIAEDSNRLFVKQFNKNSLEM